MTPLDDVWRLCDHFDAMANRGAGEPRPRPEDAPKRDVKAGER